MLKRTKGDGVIYECGRGHQWYHNTVIKTCKCLNADKSGNVKKKAAVAADEKKES